MDLSLQHPMNGLISGATQCGKSVFVATLIKHNKVCITPAPDRIIWCYTEYQPQLFQSVLGHTPLVEFYEGLLDVNILNSQIRNLVILDDLLCEIANNNDYNGLRLGMGIMTRIFDYFYFLSL